MQEDRRTVESQTRRCTECILPDKTPHIRFDADGVCNYCRSYRGISYHGEDALLNILDLHRDSSRRYDCIVNVSGGRDSSYTILKMSKDYGMRVLAVNYENPYTHPTASENIAKIKEILKIDLVSFRLKGDLHQDYFHRTLRAWCRKPSPAMVPVICLPCKLIWIQIISLAREHSVGLVISGGNLLEQVGFKRELLGVSRDASISRFYTLYATGLIREVARNPRYLSPETLPNAVRGYLYANPNAPFVRLLGRRLRRIDLFHYLPWVEDEVLSRVRTELEWRSPSFPPGTWRFDCKIGRLKDYMYNLTLGMSEREGFYSRMIREGLISREDALARISQEDVKDCETIDALLSEIDTERSVFEREVAARMGTDVTANPRAVLC
jgi:hypothetical protein